MEQKRQKALDMIERMKLQASENIQMGSELYIMHAKCAVEFADLLTELLTTEATSAPKAEIPADAPIRVTVDIDGETRVYETNTMFLTTIDMTDGNPISDFRSRKASWREAYNIYLSLVQSADYIDEDGLFKKIYEKGLKERKFKAIVLEESKGGADHD